MGWWRRGPSAATTHGRPARVDLLDVWSAEEEAPDPRAVEPIAPPIPLSRPAPRADADEIVDAEDEAGGMTCIRLNCPRQGRPTAAVRCPSCGHGTALYRDCRWPRTG